MPSKKPVITVTAQSEDQANRWPLDSFMTVAHLATLPLWCWVFRPKAVGHSGGTTPSSSAKSPNNDPYPGALRSVERADSGAELLPVSELGNRVQHQQQRQSVFADHHGAESGIVDAKLHVSMKKSTKKWKAEKGKQLL
jgi:hypothetical protein